MKNLCLQRLEYVFVLVGDGVLEVVPFRNKRDFGNGCLLKLLFFFYLVKVIRGY